MYKTFIIKKTFDNIETNTLDYVKAFNRISREKNNNFKERGIPLQLTEIIKIRHKLPHLVTK